MDSNNVIAIFNSKKYKQRAFGSLVSKRVSIFLGSDELAHKITDAIANDKKGGSGVFSVDIDFMRKCLKDIDV